MKRRDWLIIGCGLLLALLALGAWLLLSPHKSAFSSVTVYVNGQVYGIYPLDEEQTITIDQGNGKLNVIRIDEHGVCMERSSCKNQLCVNKGCLDPNNDETLFDNWIVCLPNGVTVELTGGEG